MNKINRLDMRLSNIPAEIWSKITQIDQLKGQWIAGAQLSPQVLGRLKHSVLITSTGASTRIEGARLTDENIEKLLSPKQLAVWNYLLSVTEATPMEIANNTNIARPTINQVLTKLLQLKKIERIGLGRSTRYRKI